MISGKSLEKFKNFSKDDWRDYICGVIDENDEAALRALKIVYDNQTSSEVLHGKSELRNGIGFSNSDAMVLTRYGYLCSRGHEVSDGGIAIIKRRVKKYWRQVMEQAKKNVELAEKTTTVEVLRHPTDEDWARCKMLALHTVGKSNVTGEVTDEWKRKILKAEHSPIRTLIFTIKVELPYYSSVHFARHKFGVEHYVTTQRNDRQCEYDREDAPQGQVVSHIMDINAQELINMAHRRLCSKADKTTRSKMATICAAVLKTNPEFSDVLVPMCEYQGRCPEFKPCGHFKRR